MFEIDKKELRFKKGLCVPESSNIPLQKKLTLKQTRVVAVLRLFRISSKCIFCYLKGGFMARRNMYVLISQIMQND